MDKDQPPFLVIYDLTGLIAGQEGEGDQFLQAVLAKAPDGSLGIGDIPTNGRPPGGPETAGRRSDPNKRPYQNRRARRQRWSGRSLPPESRTNRSRRAKISFSIKALLPSPRSHRAKGACPCPRATRRRKQIADRRLKAAPAEGDICGMKMDRSRQPRFRRRVSHHPAATAARPASPPASESERLSPETPQSAERYWHSLDPWRLWECPAAGALHPGPPPIPGTALMR